MKDEKAFSVELASVPDRDDLVAEVWLGQELVAELRQEHDSVLIECYAATGTWSAPYDQFVDALRRAHERLTAA